MGVAPEELDHLRPAQDKALRLERFLAPVQLDPVLYSGRSLYLVPDGPAAEPGYAVLHAVLVQRQRWALGRMVLGGHRQIVLIRRPDRAVGQVPVARRCARAQASISRRCSSGA